MFLSKVLFHFSVMINIECRTMIFPKTSKNIRGLIFRKIKYHGHMGQNTDRSVTIFVHTIQFLKNWSHFSKFQFTWESPFSHTFHDYFSNYGKI